MTKQELIETLDFSRAVFDELLENVPEAAVVRPGPNGEWSAKDVLAHLTAWEAEMVRALAQLRQGLRPEYFTRKTPVDALNEQFYRDSKDRPLERVLADFEGVREQLLRQVERFSPAELDAPPKSVKTSQSLRQLILSETLEHEQEHLPDLKMMNDE